MAKSKTGTFVLCPKRGDECDIDSCPRYLVNVEITSSRGRRTANGFCLERGSRYITGVTEDYFRDRESASTQPFYERDAKDYAERIGRIRKSVEGELFYVGHHLFDDKPKGDDGDLFDTVSDAIEYHIGQMIAGKPIAPKVGSDWSKAIPDMLSFPDDEALYRVTEHPDEHPEAEDVTLPDGTKAHVVSHLQAHPIKPHVDRVKEMTRRYLEKGLEIARFLNSDSKSAWSRALGDYERVKGAFAMPESRSVLDDMVSAMTEAATQLSVDLNIPDESKKVRDRETAAAVAETIQPQFDAAKKEFAKVKSDTSFIRHTLDKLVKNILKWFTPKPNVSEKVNSALGDRYACIARVKEPHHTQIKAVIDYTLKHPIVYEKDRKFGKEQLSLSEAVQAVFNANISKWELHPDAWKDFNSLKAACYEYRGKDNDPFNYAK